MRRTADDDLWFGYEVDMDTAHLWFTADQLNAVTVPVDEQLSLLIDDDTDEIIGFTVERFRQEYLEHLSLRERWMHRIGLRRVLAHDIPIRRIGSPRASHLSAALAEVAIEVALDHMLVAGEIEF
jgi:hypothetical protein